VIEVWFRIGSPKNKIDLTMEVILNYCTTEQSVGLIDRIRAVSEVRSADCRAASAPVSVDVHKASMIRGAIPPWLKPLFLN
jgi:hypothetical protein